MAESLAELYGAVSAQIVVTATRLRAHQCDESGAHNPDRYDNDGRDLKEQLDVLKEMREKLETIL